MFKFVSLVFVSFIYFSSSQSSAGGLDGLWLTQNERSVIDIQGCAEGLCGTIHWIIEGGQEFDEHNPEEELQSRPLCGLKILYGFEPRGEDRTVWKSGKIYKADDGDIYNANVELLDNGTLKLRGYVGVPLFGKTQIWTRVRSEDYPGCRS